MKRVWGHLLTGAALASGAAGISSACVHDNSSIFIRNVLANKAETSPGFGGCFYTSDVTQPFTHSGVLDLAVRGQYDAEFLVGNQLLPQSNPMQLRTETATVTIRGAVVRVTDSAGNQLSTFTRLTSATLDPATGSLPGYEPIAVTIVDPGSLQASADVQAILSTAAPFGNGFARLVTYTRFFGDTLGGQSVESDEFEFPVDVCNGCLIAYLDSPSYVSPDGGTIPAMSPNCIQGNSSTSTMMVPVPCVPGQDLPVPCTACSASLACHGLYPNDVPPSP